MDQGLRGSRSPVPRSRPDPRRSSWAKTSRSSRRTASRGRLCRSQASPTATPPPPSLMARSWLPVPAMGTLGHLPPSRSSRRPWASCHWHPRHPDVASGPRRLGSNPSRLTMFRGVLASRRARTTVPVGVMVTRRHGGPNKRRPQPSAPPSSEGHHDRATASDDAFIGRARTDGRNGAGAEPQRGPPCRGVGYHPRSLPGDGLEIAPACTSSTGTRSPPSPA